ncbi:MAG: hypothetical protein V4668_00895 [Patescibacteria group bacterium]
MDKSVWEVIGIPEIYSRDSHGKIILNLCAEIFSAISKPDHLHHQYHRQFTKQTLKSILMMLSRDTVYGLAQEYEWDTDEGEHAIRILDDLIATKVAELEKIVYQSVSKVRKKSRNNRMVMEDWKIACIMAGVFDFESEAEVHVEDVMEETVHKFTRP